MTGAELTVYENTGIQHNGNSCVENISRLQHNCRLRVDVSLGKLTIERIVGVDNFIVQSSRLCDPIEAGEIQINALRMAIKNRLAEGREIGVLVSGGVDSSLVAALIAEQTSEMTAFSIGTDFGDEFDDASQLTEALNKPLIKIMFCEEDILNALAPTIRAFGHADREAVEVGVAITAFCRKAAGNRLIFTGYGSDLINSGLTVDSGIAEDIREKIHKVVDKTRYSSELTNVAALACGCDLAHPYWDPMVIRIALDTCPSVKTALGREKGHLRMAAQRLLPKEIAWRKKTAIHHGNGLAAQLSGLIDSKTSRLSSSNQVYGAILIELINDAIISPFSPMAPSVIFERAIHKVSRNEKFLAVK
ncbi:asparagine synthase C-terminal domain-containing protein [Glaciimonas immobilis]|uniref:Asparagine synthetase B (Glutamine-hydrolyzing) n=1 Tax=Glaciimonas immobilis TaxID=728004 RepID=A0A840S240_9BURK|nr:asparagine synthase [Glaciimonas immobilis]KAF3996236.1 asparagine synthase [Glaciimonas immobilis]MBB5202609.1 asparagine synthetase B (glutamine-hydrolyzing) [Glaciimonas immobilis]